MKARNIFTLAVLLLAAATAKGQSAVEQAFNAIVSRRSNFTVETHHQADNLIAVYTTSRPWRDKDARKLIDDIYRAFDTDAAQCISLTRIDAKSQLAGKRYVRISVPAGEATLGGEGENILVGRFSMSEVKGRGEATYAIEWHEAGTGGFQLRLVLASAQLPDGTPAFSKSGLHEPQDELYRQLSEFTHRPTILGNSAISAIEREWNADGTPRVWEQSWSISCPRNCQSQLDDFIHCFETYRNESSFEQENRSGTIGFVDETAKGQRLYIESTEGGRYVAVTLPAWQKGYVYRYVFTYVPVKGNLWGYAMVRLLPVSGDVAAPPRDAQMETLLDILSNTEHIDRLPVDCSSELLMRGVSLEALRARVEADCETVQTMRQLRAEELKTAEEVYRAALAGAKQFLEENKEKLRTNYESSKHSHAAALRAGKLHSNEYARRMQEAADQYAKGVKSLADNYSQSVAAATDDYNARCAHIAKQYAATTSLFPDGEPTASIDSAYQQLLKARDPDAPGSTGRYILSKLRRLAAFASPQMSSAARQRWLKQLPDDEACASLRALLTETGK